MTAKRFEAKGGYYKLKPQEELDKIDKAERAQMGTVEEVEEVDETGNKRKVKRRKKK